LERITSERVMTVAGRPNLPAAYASHVQMDEVRVAIITDCA
jgi:hypothetical protein